MSLFPAPRTPSPRDVIHWAKEGIVMEYNAVFEGGGVRGIAHVGAACVLEEAGYRLGFFAGSSAGAIVASLLAAGYPARELKSILMNLDFTQFLHESGAARFGRLGKAASLFTRFGLYDADFFERWLSELLAKRGVRSFGTLALPSPRQDGVRWPLQVTACDVTDQRLLVLPEDLADFGIDPDLFPVATAVRMSMSIPFFFRPFPLKDKRGRVHLIVDGSLLSSYPVWIFSERCLSPALPTIGFDFVGDRALPAVCRRKSWPEFFCYMAMVVATSMNAIDKQQASVTEQAPVASIQIPVTVQTDEGTRRVSPIDFELSDSEKRQLLENGEQAARRFLSQRQPPAAFCASPCPAARPLARSHRGA